MKLRSAMVGGCAMLWIVTAGAQTGTTANPSQDPARPVKKADPKGPAAAKAPAAKTDPKNPAAKAAPAGAKKDEKKKDDEMGKIEGMEIPRGKGFLGLQIVNGTFKLSFYDAKKKPVKPDVARAVFRWSVPYQKMPERALLTSNGTDLVAEKIVKPPYSFRLAVTMFKAGNDGAADGDDSAENLTIEYSQ